MSWQHRHSTHCCVPSSSGSYKKIFLQYFNFYYHVFTLACPWCRAQAPERIHCGEPAEVHMPHCGHVLSSTCSQATRLQARTLPLDSAGAQKLPGSAEARPLKPLFNTCDVRDSPQVRWPC